MTTAAPQIQAGDAAPFDLAAYFERLGVDPLPATPAGLALLQQAQMRAIVFENIDPLLGRTPDLSPEAIWDKLVLARRGGYCFELNSLLGQALDAMGFSARRVMARVRMGAPVGGPRSHLAFLVTLDGAEWLVDAGFGGPGPVGPVAIANGLEQGVGGATFRVVDNPDAAELVLERRQAEGWWPVYALDRFPVQLADIEAANFVSANWPRSLLSNNLMMNLPGADGRISLLDTALKIERGGVVEKSAVGSREELAKVLAEGFRLDLPAETLEAIWSRIGQA